MKDDHFDNMMRESLAPSFTPGEELKEKILSGRKEKKKAKVSQIPKIAAIAAAVVVVSSLSVFAGIRYYESVLVTKHAISVGNPDYVDDEALANIDPNEPASPEYSTTSEEYDTYSEAKEKTGLGFDFTSDFELIDKAAHSVTTGPDYKCDELDASFKYGKGSFWACYSVTTGNIAEDAAFSVYMKNTSNKRYHESPNGNVFTLVDEVDGDKVSTYVMVCYDDVDGYIKFEYLTDEQIGEVLDAIDARIGEPMAQ